jgi:hypothetical protein
MANEKKPETKQDRALNKALAAAYAMLPESQDDETIEDLREGFANALKAAKAVAGEDGDAQHIGRHGFVREVGRRRRERSRGNASAFSGGWIPPHLCRVHRCRGRVNCSEPSLI